jgi:hypothetical protein
MQSCQVTLMAYFSLEGGLKLISAARERVAVFDVA